MSRIDDLELYAKVAGFLARPNHGYVSWNGLCRRLHLNDDKPRRAVDRLEQTFRAPLVEHRGGRLALTTAGTRLAAQVERLLALRVTFAETEQSEAVTVEADPDLVTWLLPRVLPGFLSVFAGFTHLRVCPLDVARVRSNIAGGITHFGLGLENGDESGIELVGAGIGWHLLVPGSHRLAADHSSPELGAADRVFLATATAHPDGLDEFLRHVPASNRVECGGFGAVRSCVESGQGIGIVPRLVPSLGDGIAFPLPGLSDLRVGMYLPKDVETLSDPARALVAAVRDALQPRPAPDPLVEVSIPDESDADAPDLCEVGGENP